MIPTVLNRRSTNSSTRIPPLLDVHALHKSGTMFLYRFFRRLSRLQGYRYLSENNSPPDDGSLSRETAQQGAISGGLYRCPIRSFEVDSTPGSWGFDQRRIFHVRDPRDMLVSEYYSFGWIHPTDATPLDDRRNEIRQMTVDEYVIRQSEEGTWPLDQKFAPLLEREIDPARECVVHYEQMVTDFPNWCCTVLVAAGVRQVRLMTARLAWRYRHEFRTAGERMVHKRRITPGDHREKLRPETIDVLNARFQTALSRFGYLD